MDKPNRTTIKLLIFMFYKFLFVSAQNFGLCSNPECSEPIGMGITEINYPSPHPNVLSFAQGQEVAIFVKAYGEKKELFGVMFGGIVGYIPQKFIKETSSFVKELVPAKVEFTQIYSSSAQMNSHSHVQSHGHQQDIHQHSSYNSFNPQPSAQIFQHSQSIQHSGQGVQHGGQAGQHGGPAGQHGGQGVQHSGQGIQHSGHSIQHSHGIQHSGHSVQPSGQSIQHSGVHSSGQSIQHSGVHPSGQSIQHSGVHPSGQSIQHSGVHPSGQSFQHSGQGVQHSGQSVPFSGQGAQHRAQGIQHGDQGALHSAQGVLHTAQGFQHSSVGVQHSSFPLESSRQTEHSHIHGSSDLYLVGNEDYNSYPSSIRIDQPSLNVDPLSRLHPPRFKSERWQHPSQENSAFRKDNFNPQGNLYNQGPQNHNPELAIQVHQDSLRKSFDSQNDVSFQQQVLDTISRKTASHFQAEERHFDDQSNNLLYNPASEAFFGKQTPELQSGRQNFDHQSNNVYHNQGPPDPSDHFPPQKSNWQNKVDPQRNDLIHNQAPQLSEHMPDKGHNFAPHLHNQDLQIHSSQVDPETSNRERNLNTQINSLSPDQRPEVLSPQIASKVLDNMPNPHSESNVFSGQAPPQLTPQISESKHSFDSQSGNKFHQELLTPSPKISQQMSGEHSSLVDNQPSPTHPPHAIPQTGTIIPEYSGYPTSDQDANRELEETLAMLERQTKSIGADRTRQLSPGHHSDHESPPSPQSSHVKHSQSDANNFQASDQASQTQNKPQFQHDPVNRITETKAGLGIIDSIKAKQREQMKDPESTISEVTQLDEEQEEDEKDDAEDNDIEDDVIADEILDDRDMNHTLQKQEVSSERDNIVANKSMEDIKHAYSNESATPLTTSSNDSSASSFDVHSDLNASQTVNEKEFNEDTFSKKKAVSVQAVHDSIKDGSSKRIDLNNSSVETDKKDLPADILDNLPTDSSSTQSDSNNTLQLDKDSGADFISDFAFQDVEANVTDSYLVDKSLESNDVQNSSVPELLVSTDQSSDLDNLLNNSDVSETKSLEYINAYQTRHLKDVENSNENLAQSEEVEETINYSEFNFYTSLENSFEAIRSFVEALLPWIPDPLYTIIIDLEKEGISPKVPVFTALSAVPCIILMVLLVYIKENSKEKKLIAQLTILEKNLYNLTAEKNILEEKLEKIELELQISRTMLEEEKISSYKMKTEVECLSKQVEETTLELEKNVDAVDAFKEREREYMELVRDHEKEHLTLLEQKTDTENRLVCEEGTVYNLTEKLQEKETEIEKLLLEKSEYCQSNEVYEEKLAQLQKNCSQLLQEAEVWNMRVTELNEKLNKESSAKEELESSIKDKDSEIEALTEAVQIFKSFEEIGDSAEEEFKTNEEKLQYLKNSSSILIKLQKQEDEKKSLTEMLSEEKTKVLEMEVALLESTSENEKLKLSYNQALQNKTEAQTKLDVLTNYFKDKELQMQKQLGVQEAVRQRTEEDASSAERKIALIDQENSSYKYQVATMKQEMEETERNLKSQIAVQEKKAHDNWLAARTAERKLEDNKQEITQLRQRLTLLEREQENWSNSNRDEIIRPVPKRIKEEDMNSQDVNSSIELRPNMFPPPPMMLPLDRPLPPLPPMPPFMPPFDPSFPPQPWHMPPHDSLSNSDYRITPTDFGRGRESTPPRGRNSAIIDGDMGPRQSSPLGDIRDSRNSTPPHLLPDFHDIPPHPPRPFFPPIGSRMRYPLPPFRRDLGQGQRRIDNQDDGNSSYSSQHSSVPPDSWHNPNSRV